MTSTTTTNTMVVVDIRITEVAGWGLRGDGTTHMLNLDRTWGDMDEVIMGDVLPITSFSDIFILLASPYILVSSLSLSPSLLSLPSLSLIHI